MLEIEKYKKLQELKNRFIKIKGIKKIKSII